MNKKIINLIIIIWIGVSVLFSSAIAYYCSRSHFLKTTGFYFSGINYTEIGDIQATGFNKQHHVVRNIYCLLHYRQTDDYIFDDWRWDFKYYDLIDSIHLIIPNKLLPKIEKVWFKYDKTVACLSNKDLINTWSHKTFEDDTYFFIPKNLTPKNSFIDGVMCMVYVKGNLFKIVRYTMVCCVFIAALLVFLRFFSIIKMAGKYIYTKTRNVFSKHKSFFSRLFSFLLGIFFTLLILEVTLRIVGYIHNQKNIEKQFKKDVKTKDVIICVGDSFTESIGSSEDNDYPSQLGRIINQDTSHHYTVLNFGRSGKNTAQIALEVPVYIKKYNPRLIVFMVGSANYWNYWGYKKDRTDASLRFITFFKLLVQNIQNKRYENVFKPEQYIIRREEYLSSLKSIKFKETPLLKAIRTHDSDIIDKYIDSCRKNCSLSERDLLYLTLFSSLSGKAEYYDRLLINTQDMSDQMKFYLLLSGRNKNENSLKNSYIPYQYQAVYYYIKEMQKSKFDENILQNCLRLNPYFEEVYFQLYTLGHHNITLPEDYNQKCFSIMDSINFYTYLFGIESKSHGFDNVNIEENLEGSLSSKKIDQWVAEDVEKMILICKQNGIEVILMNYPLLYNTGLFYSVNNVLKKTAEKYNIAFINNNDIFNNIKTNRSSYFISDGHCSDKGYHLISSNIYKILIENKYIVSKNGGNAH